MYKNGYIVSVQYNEFNTCVINALRYRKLLSPQKTLFCPSQYPRTLPQSNQSSDLFGYSLFLPVIELHGNGTTPICGWLLSLNIMIYNFFMEC